MDSNYTGVIKVDVVNYKTIEELNQYLYDRRLDIKWEYRVIQIEPYDKPYYEEIGYTTLVGHEAWLRVWIEKKERK